jgi:perosamine synthetase
MQVPQMSPWLGAAEAEAASAAVASNWITEGPRSAEFVDRLKALIGSPYAVLAPNGTLALYLGLSAMGIGPGDEVIVPDVTFIASANAVIMAGATPVFVDVNTANYQIDLTQADALVNERTAAVMPVHLYGMAANMAEVDAFAQRHQLKVIEDAAQGIAVRYHDQHVGTFGQVGCFSFFADKTITTGEGGLVVCNDEATYEQLQLLRNQGRLQRGSFVHPAVGYNLRLTDLAAAVGLVQLDKLDQIVQRKQHILQWYHRELDRVDQVSFIAVEPGSTHVPFRAVLICEAAQRLAKFCEQRGIQTRQNFYPLHRQPCFAYLGQAHGGRLDLDDRHFPNAIQGYERALLFPSFAT